MLIFFFPSLCVCNCKLSSSFPFSLQIQMNFPSGILHTREDLRCCKCKPLAFVHVIFHFSLFTLGLFALLLLFLSLSSFFLFFFFLFFLLTHSRMAGCCDALIMMVLVLVFFVVFLALRVTVFVESID